MNQRVCSKRGGSRLSQELVVTLSKETHKIDRNTARLVFLWIMVVALLLPIAPAFAAQGPSSVGQQTEEFTGNRSERQQSEAPKKKNLFEATWDGAVGAWNWTTDKAGDAVDFITDFSDDSWMYKHTEWVDGFVAWGDDTPVAREFLGLGRWNIEAFQAMSDFDSWKQFGSDLTYGVDEIFSGRIFTYSKQDWDALYRGLPEYADENIKRFRFVPYIEVVSKWWLVEPARAYRGDTTPTEILFDGSRDVLKLAAGEVMNQDLQKMPKLRGKMPKNRFSGKHGQYWFLQESYKNVGDIAIDESNIFLGDLMVAIRAGAFDRAYLQAQSE